MNWGEIKLMALQKINPTIDNLNATRLVRPYLNGMIGAANRGLQDLATAGKFIPKEYKIIQYEIDNVLGHRHEVYQVSDKAEFGGVGKSYYLEVAGNATIDIYIDDTLTDSISNVSDTFTAYKGNLSNPDEKPVRIEISSAYPFMYRNVAIYPVGFASDADVYEFTPVHKYNLKTLLSDFYRLVRDEVIYEGSGLGTEYYWESDSVLVLKGAGEWTVYYYAYPQEITYETTDDTEMELDPEVAALLPVYIASQLIEDEDSNMAYYFLQQYQESKARLNATYSAGREKFNDVNGW